MASPLTYSHPLTIKLKSLDNLIDELDKLKFGDRDDTCVKEAIVQLKYYKQKIVMDPCYKIPQSVFRLRQAQFKDKHKRSKHSDDD